jgi:UDP-N-acetyl-D-galactosamine dehydrogenase
MGVTFKENCPDIRNSKVFELFKKLSNDFSIDTYDPYASKNEVYKKHKIHLHDFNNLENSAYDCIVVAVGHTEFLNINIESLRANSSCLVYDLKGIYNNKKYMRL